jgi:shikimate dehydrogenase
MTSSGDPKRYAVIGNPVAHSRSPFIHQCFARQTGIALTYERLLAPLDGFEAAANGFFASGGHGLNITVPFKEAAWRLAADSLSERARRAGSVNTLWNEGGVLRGCNTDGVGLIADLERLGAKPHGARILLIGAGGAARGVIGPLLDAGCDVLHVVNRTAARAHALLDPATPALSAGTLEAAADRGP